MLFRQSGTLPADAHKGINAWIIYIALPALSLKYIPHIEWSAHLLLAALTPVIVWLGGWLYCSAYFLKKAVDLPTRGAIKISAGLSNTGFVGFPLVMAYFGEQHLGIAVICDQVSFTLLSTAAIIVAINSSKKQELSAAVVLKKLFRFPPFLGCLAAIILPQFINLTQAEPLFDKLAATVGPLALFSMGLQLQFRGWKKNINQIAVALFYKLFIAPLLILSVVMIFQMKGTVAQTSIFEAAMPTVLTAGVIADEYQLNPSLANQIIGIGILISFASTALWYGIIQWLL
jgi:predicted permease